MRIYVLLNNWSKHNLQLRWVQAAPTAPDRPVTWGFLEVPPSATLDEVDAAVRERVLDPSQVEEVVLLEEVKARLPRQVPHGEDCNCYPCRLKRNPNAELI